MIRALLGLVAVATLTGCASNPTQLHRYSPPAASTSKVFPSAMASDYGPILDEIPWCDDPHGNSAAQVWPCQWDRRESAAPGWDPTVPQVAIFVRAADGCPEAVDTSNQAWACYWRPQDQAGATP